MNGFDPKDPKDIEDIILRAKRGDNDAFTSLYEAYFSPLYRYIYFRVGNASDTEDLIQDVFVKAYSTFDRYTFLGNSPLAYFYTIARNTVIDHAKKKRPISMDIEDMLVLPDENTQTPQEEAIQKEEQFKGSEALREALLKLPPDQQDAITSKYMGGLSNEEIGRLLGKSEEAVRKLQSRGIQTLRKNMAGMEEKIF